MNPLSATPQKATVSYYLGLYHACNIKSTGDSSFKLLENTSMIMKSQSTKFNQTGWMQRSAKNPDMLWNVRSHPQSITSQWMQWWLVYLYPCQSWSHGKLISNAMHDWQVKLLVCSTTVNKERTLFYHPCSNYIFYIIMAPAALHYTSRSYYAGTGVLKHSLSLISTTVITMLRSKTWFLSCDSAKHEGNSLGLVTQLYLEN